MTTKLFLVLSVIALGYSFTSGADTLPLPLPETIAGCACAPAPHQRESHNHDDYVADRKLAFGVEPPIANTDSKSGDGK
ncbi:hypothetical protein [Leeia oryzae]|uniref:hypothetical protein n=1 Tax=Leeia oryzae TaxID=356662 RepID=UPI0012E9AA9B|nr:hypothetical protein [Leeia oryzae]